MLALGHSRVPEVTLVAVKAIVKGVAQQVDDMDTEDIHWEKVLDLVKATDYLLVDTFRADGLGRVIAFRVFSCFSVATGSTFLGLIHRNNVAAHMYQMIGVGFAAGGCGLLFRLGRISERCSNTVPGSGNLKAVLVQKIANQIASTDSEHLTLLGQLNFYLRERRMGVELMGMRITTSLVATITLRCCCYLQAVIATLREVVWLSYATNGQSGGNCQHGGLSAANITSVVADHFPQ